jgi:hypothetical protein
MIIVQGDSMDERILQAEIAAANRGQLRRRVKRGVVAGYIHELSARHRDAGARRADRPDPALAQSRAA